MKPIFSNNQIGFIEAILVDINKLGNIIIFLTIHKELIKKISQFFQSFFDVCSLSWLNFTTLMIH